MDLELSWRPVGTDTSLHSPFKDNARSSKCSGFTKKECTFSFFSAKASRLSSPKAHSGYGSFLEVNGSPSSRRCKGSLLKRTSIITAAATETFVDFRKEFKDEVDFVKAGGSQLEFVQMQALKDLKKLRIADQLEPIQQGEETLDLIVIGCGPAGLSLAAEAGKQGLTVGIIGPDLPFTNNYGVWEDEFTALGLENCIEHVWKETVVYLESDEPIHMGRAYGRVSRHKLREELLRRCASAGVKYLESKVERIVQETDRGSVVLCSNGMLLSCRLVTAASGAASGRFLHYERGGPEICVQTAYGIEVNVESCPYDSRKMVFMDYRDYMGGNDDGPPSFLYVMPMSPTQVFFEETCLAARPLLSFGKLKERLYIRLEKLNVKITEVLEEEWSYIPVGVAVPDTTQQHLGFGAAASMVHPATGYSVVRSLSEAPSYAAAIASALRAKPSNHLVRISSISAKAAALEAWSALWPKERKRQRAFFMFGLELILQLDVNGVRMFFNTFFQLPEWMWKGFLAANLSSAELVWFAIMTFFVAPNDLRYRLVRHLMVDPSGSNLIRMYTSL
ncbi:hypothetical protein L7F22_051686 [Adiantum nelumboides]|nr:hypothetical protein [Adiantum nelumboides]